MGVYIYTLRKSKPVKTQLGKVYRYQFKERLAGSDYYCRYTNKHVSPHEKQQRMVERIEANFDYMEDCLVVIGGDGLEGSDVYRQSESVPVWYDCDRMTGEWVGVLRKSGRSWVVCDLKEESKKYTSILKAYAEKSGLTPFILPDEDLLSFAKRCFGAFSRDHGEEREHESGFVSLRIAAHNKKDYWDIWHAIHIGEKIRNGVDKRVNID